MDYSIIFSNHCSGCCCNAAAYDLLKESKNFLTLLYKCCKKGIKTLNKSLMQTCSELTLYKSGSGISHILPSSDWDWTMMSGTLAKKKPKPYARRTTSWKSRKFRVRCKILERHLHSRRSVFELIILIWTTIKRAEASGYGGSSHATFAIGHEML